MYISRSLRLLYGAGFLFAFQIALTSYLNSSMIASFIGTERVSLVYSLSALLGLCAFFFGPRIVRAIGTRQYGAWIGVSGILSLLLIAYKTLPTPISIVACVVYLLTNTVMLFLLDTLIEHATDNSHTGKTRGLYLTITSLGWVCSPFIATQLLTIDTTLPYVLSAVLSLGTLYILQCQTDHPPRTIYTPSATPSKQTMSRQIILANVLHFFLHFFFSLMVVYMPFFLHKELGISWHHIGIMFTIMLTPFILFEYLFGWLADKWWGEKELLIGGFLCMAISSLLIGSLWLTTLSGLTALLFLSRVGASATESMIETYYFKQISEKDLGHMAVFRMASPLAYLIAPLSVSYLVGESYSQIFVFLGVTMLFATSMVIYLRDTK